MTKRIAIVGDKTTSGGVIISGTQSWMSDGADVALVGDKVSCPSCGKIGVIVEGASTFIIEGKQTAYDGCLVACGCPTNRIIAMKSSMFLDEPSYGTAISSENNKTVINDVYSRLFSIVDSIEKKPLINIAYGIKTRNELIHGISGEDGKANSLNTEQAENVQVSYLFQTKIGI